MHVTLKRIQINMRTMINYRIQNGSMTVKLLSAKSGVGQSHVSNFVHGKRNLSLDSMDKLMRALGMDIEVIVVGL
jgi:plasmid maintenance system antidote protein VapI